MVKYELMTFYLYYCVVVVVFRFDEDMYSVEEGNTLSVCVAINSSSTLARNTSVMVNTMDESAVGESTRQGMYPSPVLYIEFLSFLSAPEDYTAVMVTLVFGPDNMVPQCVSINTTGDGEVGMAIGFLVLLVTNDASVTLDRPVSIVDITEADSKLGTSVS